MLTVGIEGRQEQMVSDAMTADKIGSGSVPVFATPMMVALMERTCSESVQPWLDDGQTTVGVRLDISHLSATPVGMRVWCKSELTEIDRRRLTFRVATYDEAGLIGEGCHERFIVDADAFVLKARAKHSH